MSFPGQGVAKQALFSAEPALRKNASGFRERLDDKDFDFEWIGSRRPRLEDAKPHCARRDQISWSSLSPTRPLLPETVDEWCAHPPRPLRASTETRRRMRRAPRVRKTSPRSSARAIRAPNRPIAIQNGRGGEGQPEYFVRCFRDRTISFASRAPLRAFFACFLAAARHPAMTARRARFPGVEIAGGATRRIAFPSGRVTSTPRPNPSGSILIPNRIIYPNSSVSPPRHLTPRQVSQDEAKK